MVSIYNQINNDCVALIQSNKNAQAAWKLNKALMDLSSRIEIQTSVIDCWSNSPGSFVAGAAGAGVEALHVQRLCEISLPTVSSSKKQGKGPGNNLYDEGLAVMYAPLLSEEKGRFIPTPVLLAYNLAIALLKLHENDRAIDLFYLSQSFLVSNEDVDNETHQTIKAASFQRIGDCFLCEEKYTDAIANYEHSLNLFKSNVGTKGNELSSLLVAASLNCIGLCHLYKPDSSPNEATRFFVEALGMRHMVLGYLRDKDSATIMYNLGKAMLAEKNFIGAFEMSERAFRLRKELVGLHHPDVGAALLSAGLAAFNLGDLQVAKTLCLEYLNLSNFPNGHEVTYYQDNVLVLKRLAQIYQRLSNSDAAISILKRAYERAMLVFGDTHQEVAEVLKDLGRLHSKLGRHGDAIGAVQSCLAIETKIAYLSGNNENVTASTAILSDMLCSADRFEDAVEVNHEIIRIHSSDVMTQADSLLVSNTWIRIGLIYSRYLEFFDKAVVSFNNALDIRIDELGETDSDVLPILRMIGNAFSDQGDLDLAAEIFDEYVILIRTLHNTSGADLSDALYDLGQAQLANNNFPKALSAFHEALNIEKGITGSKRIRIPAIISAIGSIYSNQNAKSKALRWFEKSRQCSFTNIEP